MNVGALTTIAVMDPANLAIVCVDNGHYGETGYQKSHTSLGTDLPMMAGGSGIKLTRTIEQPADIAPGARLISEANGNRFCVAAARRADRVALASAVTQAWDEYRRLAWYRESGEFVPYCLNSVSGDA